MSAISVAAASHFYNPAFHLAKLLALSFDYFCQHPNLDSNPCIEDLQSVVGLGFTICLMRSHRNLELYQGELKSFMAYGEGDFRKCSDHLLPMASVIVGMIELTLESIYFGSYLEHTRLFFDSLEKTLDNAALRTLEKNVTAQYALRALWLKNQEKI
jgi:hypothetical protein